MITAILSFNHPNLTSRCVHSALKFLKPEQVLLVHNGSRAENIAALKNEFSHIHHATIEINCGFSGGANFALKTAFEKLQVTTNHTDSNSINHWVYFVTNDCELLNAPSTPHKPGLYAPLIYRRQTQKIDSIGGLFDPLKGQLKHFHNIETAQKFMSSNKLSIRKKYFYVPGTAFFIDNKTFSALNGFDESLHTYWEDVDLSTRATKLNLYVGIHPKTQLMHKVGKTCHKDPFYTNVLFKRNRKTISARHIAKWLKPLQNIYIK